MIIEVTCETCSGTGNMTPGGGRNNLKDRCTTCGGSGKMPGRTGETAASSWPLAVPGARSPGPEIVRHIKSGGVYEVMFRNAAIDCRPSEPIHDDEEIVIVRHPTTANVHVWPAHWKTENWEVIAWGKIQTDVPLNDGDTVVVYVAFADRKVWARRSAEMDDGRFEPIPAQAMEAGGDVPVTPSPVGEVEGLKNWLAQHCETADYDAQCHPEDSTVRAFYSGQAIAYENALSRAPRLHTPPAGIQAAREALQRIADLRNSDAGEPFDDALNIADAALRVLRPPIPGQREGGEHQEGRDPDGSGSRASIEPADAVSPASGGIDPSRIADLARNVARSIMGGPAEICTNRKEFLEGSIPLIEDALKSVREVPYGIIDPDYAKIFTKARCIAWAEGYALLMHGSFTRDLDLLAVPWAERACEPEHLARRIAAATDLKFASVACGQRPHGRLAWTLLFPAFGDPRFVDLSIMPRARDQRASREDGESQPRPEAAL